MAQIKVVTFYHVTFETSFYVISLVSAYRVFGGKEAGVRARSKGHFRMRFHYGTAEGSNCHVYKS